MACREERLARALRIRQQLKELRLARIERLHDVRTSLVLTESIRLTMKGKHREEIRAHIKRMRIEVREMLEQYKANRLANKAAVKASSTTALSASSKESETNTHTTPIRNVFESMNHSYSRTIDGTGEINAPVESKLTGATMTSQVVVEQGTRLSPSNAPVEEEPSYYKRQLSRVIERISDGKSVRKGKKSSY